MNAYIYTYICVYTSIDISRNLVIIYYSNVVQWGHHMNHDYWYKSSQAKTESISGAKKFQKSMEHFVQKLPHRPTRSTTKATPLTTTTLKRRKNLTLSPNYLSIIGQLTPNYWILVISFDTVTQIIQVFSFLGSVSHITYAR